MELSSNLAARAYQNTAIKQQSESRDAQSAIGEAAKSFSDVLAEGEAVAAQSLTGDADPHALVEALAQSQLAVETAVAVRDKVVEAYQEILRMPV